ncbi:MAG: peptidoglycan-binding protein [Nitrosomonas sp.]|nr:peptidoglycan-binding protein [Nitrosomonas sp.]
MEGILNDLSDTFGDAVDETGDAISETTDDLISAVEDNTPSAEDIVNEATEVGETITDAIETSVVEPVAAIIEDADEVVAATPNLIRQIQQALTNAGYQPGPADGISGPRTINALKSFQQDNNLASGELTKETLRALGVDY